MIKFSLFYCFNRNEWFRAKKTLQEMGLVSVAQSQVGGGAAGIAAASAQAISGGQRRRLSIAQELLGNPKVIFLDEV